MWSFRAMRALPRTIFTLFLASAACAPAADPLDIKPGAADVTENPAQEPAAAHDAAAMRKATTAHGSALLSADALTEAYRAQGHAHLLSLTDGTLTPAGSIAHERLTQAHLDGLDPNDFHAQTFGEHKGDGAAAELLLMDGLVRYAKAMDRAPAEVDTAALLAAAMTAAKTTQALRTWLDGLRPANPQYAALMKAAAHYTEIVDAGGWPTKMPRLPLPDPKKPFRYKANYKRYPEGVVRLVKERLAGERLYDGTIDNQWDEALTPAVVGYRRMNGLEEKPYIDYEMTRAMQVTAPFRLAQIHLNLERLRSSRFGQDPYYVYVNVPAFHGELWDKAERKLTFRTIVGNRRKNRHKKTRKFVARDATPLFSDKMETVVMAPYWTVPASIRVQLLRRAEKDPDFLARDGYDVVAVPSGKLLRQRPGKRNALGRVKFLFPNEHDIYLHDTPDRYLFTLPMRAYSHGCIRVQKPLDLAIYILQRQDPEWTMRKLERRGNASVETAVALDDGPTVHLEYITVTVPDDGELRFHWDIYHHDTRAIADRKGLEYKGDLYYP
jgi:murein L,D-transpeptidase YcbB/YkuD